MDITNLITVHNNEQTQWEADDRRHQLDELAETDRHEFWKALFTEAIETAKENRYTDDWVDGQVIELGGGATLARDFHPGTWGRDNLTLTITEANVTTRLATIGSAHNIDEYQIIKNGRSYAHNVRSHERTLCTQAQALDEAYQVAVENLGELVNGRLERAYNLALAGAVTLDSDGRGAAVKSQTGNGGYHVNGYKCTCPDWRAPMLGEDKLCKHKLAYWLVKKASDGATQRPAPVQKERML